MNNGTVALANPADISVIVIYFLVVLAVGVWVRLPAFVLFNRSSYCIIFKVMA